MTSTELKTKLTASLEHFESELSQIRTGRVTPALLDHISVTVYESELEIRELATITSLDAQTLSITPWDKTVLADIAKAVRTSELQLDPAIKNDSVIVTVPSMTDDRREEFKRLISIKLEECKTALRNIRQDAMKQITSAFEAKEFGEDEKFRQKAEVEEIVKDFSVKAEELAEAKKQKI